MRYATTLAMLAACALAAAHPAWADDPVPDLGVAVGIVWDGGLPYALTFDPETELGDAAWNVTGGMDMVWPHPYTVDDIEWGSELGYAHIPLDGARHAVVAAVDGPPVLVHIGDAEPYTGENSRESGSGMAVQWNGGLLVVTQGWWTGPDFLYATHHFAGAEGPPVEFRCPPEVCAPFHIHPKDGRPIEIQGRLSVGWDSEPTMILVHVDGAPHAVVNTVEGPPVLADPMEAAALGLGNITEMEPDICVWPNGPAWADCANPPDGPPPPLPAPTVPFNVTLRTVWPSNTVSVEVGGPGPYTIDWGDGNVQTVAGAPIVDPDAHVSVFTPQQILGHEPLTRPSEIRHDYGGGGTWEMSIIGDVDWVRLGGTHLMSIDQWGDIRWKTMRSAFYGSPNLVHAAADAPDISRVTDMSGMFAGALSVGDISSWNVSQVTDMSKMFASVRSIGDISGWDVSSVTDMRLMFYNSNFNGDISEWDVSSVADMSGMFSTSPFNGDISEWDVSSVEDMSGMFFNNANSFKHSIGNWFITLDDLTVTDAGLVVGRIVPQNPSFYGRISYEVVRPADSTFRIEPGDPILVGSGVPLVTTHGSVYEPLLVLSPNHNLTLGMHNVTIQATTGVLANPSAHTKQVSVQYSEPRPPVARAGPSQTVLSGQEVTLNGTNSHDPDGDQLVYMWNQTGGPSVALHGADSPYLTFTAPPVQYLNTLTFSLVVHDGELYSPEYTAIVLVEPARP